MSYNLSVSYDLDVSYDLNVSYDTVMLGSNRCARKHYPFTAGTYIVDS